MESIMHTRTYDITPTLDSIAAFDDDFSELMFDEDKINHMLVEMREMFPHRKPLSD
jgi:hypothetical protein